MPAIAKVNSAITFLRAEIPTEDISANPVVAHPHNTSRTIPERLPPEKIKELSRVEPAKAIAATAGEWASIAAAIALCTYFWNPLLYVLAVMFIGARQHALIIIGHDASHYRYLPKRWQNELFSNLFLMWPVFASVEGFRKFHSTHHQYTNLSNDGNRHIWYTHDAAGELAPDVVAAVGFHFVPDRAVVAVALGDVAHARDARQRAGGILAAGVHLHIHGFRPPQPGREILWRVDGDHAAPVDDHDALTGL